MCVCWGGGVAVCDPKVRCLCLAVVLRQPPSQMWVRVNCTGYAGRELCQTPTVLPGTVTSVWLELVGKPGLERFKMSLKEKAHDLLAQDGRRGRDRGQGAGTLPRGGHSCGEGGEGLPSDRYETASRTTAI